MNGVPELDACGCCETMPPQAPPVNRSGLPALAYRIARYPSFFARMLDRIHAQEIADGPNAGTRPLAALTTRASEDPAIALIDAAATLADVLTFYQERIANEGFLRTATERRSVLELARAIGYELAPGVAASAYLSFTVEDHVGNPGSATIPAGTKVQSVPAQGAPPQTFETAADIEALAAWNALQPRLTQSQDLALVNNNGSWDLYLLGLTSDFAAADGVITIEQPNFGTIYPLFSTTTIDTTLSSITALHADQVFLSGVALNVHSGDRLLFVGISGSGDVQAVVKVVHAFAEASTAGATGTTTVNLTAEEPSPPPPPQLSWRAVDYLTAVYGGRFTDDLLRGAIGGTTMSEDILRGVAAEANWSLVEIVTAANYKPPPIVSVEQGIFALRTRVGFFGANAPKFASLTADQQKAYPNMTAGNNAATPPIAANNWDTNPPTIWEDSSGVPLGNATVYLERSVPGIVGGGWAVFEDGSSGSPYIYAVGLAGDLSVADFALSGRVTAMSLSGVDGKSSANIPASGLSFRNSTAFVQSESLTPADIPIGDDVDDHPSQLMLDAMVTGLSVGQPIGITGTQSNPTGVPGAEVAVVSDIQHSGGFTTLFFKNNLVKTYIRSTMKINANTVVATNGETVNEVLGSGSASAVNQTFTLKRPPLTYVSAANAAGARSTLAVRVNGVLWTEVPTLYGLGPADRSYVVRLADDGTTSVEAGDGIVGARLPSGRQNVKAVYRTGIGSAGNVQAGTLTLLQSLPLGVRGVTNVVGASGAADPQILADARQNAPLTVLTMDRIVSIDDYQNFAGAFAGVGKAQAVALWTGGQRFAYVTIAAADGSTVDPTSVLYGNLTAAITAACDPTQSFRVASFTPVLFNVTVSVLPDPTLVASDVLSAVEAALLAQFGWQQRAFGQGVSTAEIVTTVAGVSGVIASDVSQLFVSTGPLAQRLVFMNRFGPRTNAFFILHGYETEPPAVLFAASATVVPGGVAPAQLLYINPAGVTVTEMSP